MFFLAEQYNGFGILNATIASTPQKIVSYCNFGPPIDVQYWNNSAYLLIENKGFEIVDITNLSNPTMLHQHHIGSSISKIAVTEENTVSIIHETKGLLIYGKDTDQDGLTDVFELEQTFTDPTNADTDFDGLDDSEEYFEYKTDPLNNDTDFDTFLDGVEVENG